MPIDRRVPLLHTSTSSEDEPSWASVDQQKLPRMAFAAVGRTTLPDTWQFAHHWVADASADSAGRWNSGTLFLHLEGLSTAWAAALAEAQREPSGYEVVCHLRRHWNELGYTAEDLQKRTPEYDVAALDAAMVSAGKLSVNDITLSLGARARRVLR